MGARLPVETISRKESVTVGEIEGSGKEDYMRQCSRSGHVKDISCVLHPLGPPFYSSH